MKQSRGTTVFTVLRVTVHVNYETNENNRIAWSGIAIKLTLLSE